jgi:hypothetical protein
MEDLAQLFRLMKIIIRPTMIIIFDQTQGGRLAQTPLK